MAHPCHLRNVIGVLAYYKLLLDSFVSVLAGHIYSKQSVVLIKALLIITGPLFVPPQK